MATRDEIITAIEENKRQADRLVSATPAGKWSAGVYENGWNARDLLSHLASTSAVGGFVMTTAKTPPGSGTSGGGAFDNDDFNAQQVALRESKSVRELADEIMANCERDIQAIRGAPDDLLDKHYKAPWESEGPVSDVILGSIRGHIGVHLRELAAALSP